MAFAVITHENLDQGKVGVKRMIKAGQIVTANPTARKGFLIPVSWEVMDFIRVQADSLEEALEWLQVHADEVPLGTEPTYVIGSYEFGCAEECEAYLDEVVEYPKRFASGQEMYEALKETDLYCPSKEIYVFLYNEDGAICYYNIPKAQAKKLNAELAEIGENYWGALLGPGGYIIDAPAGEPYSPIDWCNFMYSEEWVPTSEFKD